MAIDWFGTCPCCFLCHLIRVHTKPFCWEFDLHSYYSQGLWSKQRVGIFTNLSSALSSLHSTAKFIFFRLTKYFFLSAIQKLAFHFISSKFKFFLPTLFFFLWSDFRDQRCLHEKLFFMWLSSLFFLLLDTSQPSFSFIHWIFHRFRPPYTGTLSPWILGPHFLFPLNLHWWLISLKNFISNCSS